MVLLNGVSERALRNLVLGRHNWLYFANETGLRWYVTFRSLIASCALHGLNAQHYLEQVLRLAPHWPVTRMLELAPKYFARTLEQLDPQHQQALLRPWDVQSRIVDLDADRGAVSRAA
jgi:transposase